MRRSRETESEGEERRDWKRHGGRGGKKIKEDIGAVGGRRRTDWWRKRDRPPLFLSPPRSLSISTRWALPVKEGQRSIVRYEGRDLTHTRDEPRVRHGFPARRWILDEEQRETRGEKEEGTEGEREREAAAAKVDPPNDEADRSANLASIHALGVVVDARRSRTNISA